LILSSASIRCALLRLILTKGENKMKSVPTWALVNMIKALSIMAVLNTPEENQRLKDAQKELNKRKGRK
jgi:hypothetical protein